MTFHLNHAFGISHQLLVNNKIPNLEIVDSFQMITSDLSAISIDNQSPLITVDGQAIYKHGAAKTNINLGMLNDGDLGTFR